jgi:hypothetical protein
MANKTQTKIVRAKFIYASSSFVNNRHENAKIFSAHGTSAYNTDKDLSAASELTCPTLKPDASNIGNIVTAASASVALEQKLHNPNA